MAQKASVYAETRVLRPNFNVNDRVIEGTKMRLVGSWPYLRRITNLTFTFFALGELKSFESVRSCLSGVVDSESTKTPSNIRLPSGEATEVTFVALDTREISSSILTMVVLIAVVKRIRWLS